LAVGGAAVAAVVAFDLGGVEEHEPPPLRGRAAARAFLTTWRESRLATWVVEGTYERRTTSGRRVASEVRVAQRPPDRLVVGLGAVQARRDARRLACAPDPDGVLRCADDGRAPPYAAEVEDEVRVLATYVEGDVPLYEVTADDPGCFTLRLVVELPAPPYGRRARFCFDPVTHAPLLAEIRRTEATDVRRTITVRTTVTDEDLAPPPGQPG
jgi:hypothetical protein